METVSGPVSTASLGQVLMHEHVFVLTPDMLAENGDYFDEPAMVTEAIAKLRALADAGIGTIVDPTVIGNGRYLPRLRRINAEVDLNIVVATGLYVRRLPHFFAYRGPGTLFGGEEPMTTLFLRELTTGIGDSGVKAAFLKCVIEEPGPDADEARIAKAVAAAHRETGAPITVHTDAARQSGRRALRLFRDEGVDLTKVVVGHAGDSNDLDYLRWIADQGAYIGCDRFGLDVFNSGAERIATVAALCARGYAEKIVLSHDAACFMDYFADPLTQRKLAETLPDWHYLHIPQTVVPALRKAGVTEEQVRRMLVDNPRRYFEPNPVREGTPGAEPRRG